MAQSYIKNPDEQWLVRIFYVQSRLSGGRQLADIDPLKGVGVFVELFQIQLDRARRAADSGEHLSLIHI